MNSFCKLILKFISWINFRIFILTKGKTLSTTPSSLGEGKLPMSSAHNPPNATAPWRGNKLLFFLNFKSPQWNKRLPPAKISIIKAFKRLPPPPVFQSIIEFCHIIFSFSLIINYLK